MNYSLKEQRFLWAICLIGFAILNTVFIYYLVFSAETITAAFKNPVAAVFIVESFLLMGVLAYLLNKWQLSRLHWAWFIVLSLVGGMAFALPIVLLWPKKTP